MFTNCWSFAHRYIAGETKSNSVFVVGGLRSYPYRGETDGSYEKDKAAFAFVAKEVSTLKEN